MLYQQYTVDYNEKSAVMDSEKRVITCINPITGERKQLTTKEEIIFTLYFMTIQFHEEQNGQDNGNHFVVDKPGLSLEQAANSIRIMHRSYGIDALKIETPSEERVHQRLKIYALSLNQEVNSI